MSGLIRLSGADMVKGLLAQRPAFNRSAGWGA